MQRVIYLKIYKNLIEFKITGFKGKLFFLKYIINSHSAEHHQGKSSIKKMLKYKEFIKILLK